ARLLIALRELEAGVVERLPRAVAARERNRRGLADMADAQRIDETLERDLAARGDRTEQVGHGGFAIALDLLELDPLVAFFEHEDVGRLLDPALLEEEHDLLLAEPVDVEGAPRHEVPQVLDLLERTGELAGAMGAHALLAAGDRLAHHLGLERTRARGRKLVGLRPARLVLDHAEHLRDDIAGALDHHRVADADAEPL